MAKYSFLRKYYPFIVLVVGICLVCCVVNVKEAFANPVLQPLIAAAPGQKTVRVYLFMKDASNITIVPPTTADPIIDVANTKMQSNMLQLALKDNYNVQDFVAYGFGKNGCTSATQNKDGQCWGIGIVDQGPATISLATMDGKLQNRSMAKGLSKLPTKAPLKTCKIGPISPAAFGGPTTMNLKTGDPAKDGGKVSGPANVYIDILLSK
jgi:hypothetical protein